MLQRTIILALSCWFAVACGEGATNPSGTGSGAGYATGGQFGTGGTDPGSGGGGQTGGGGTATGGAPTGSGSSGGNPSAGGSTGTGGEGQASGGGSSEPQWLPSWATSIQGYESSKTDHQPPIALPNNTLRQFVWPTYDGDEVRIQISNEKGEGPLDVQKVHLAHPTSGGAIDAASDVALTFNGSPSVTVPAGQTVWSDGAAFTVQRAELTAISIQFGATVPSELTTHPGARTTSYFSSGDAVSLASIGNQTRDRWYFINALEVMAPADAFAIALLGDSITDGYGVLNAFQRWGDFLTLEIENDPMIAGKVSVLNFGMGANTITEGTEDQDAGTERFVRDVLSRDKVKWVIVLEGVNDINYVTDITAQKIIDAHQTIITGGKEKGIKMYGSPITPMGSDNAIRNEFNAWIRTSGAYDAVIDFDAAISDPNNQHSLLPAYDSGDGLHPSVPQGYQAMGTSVDLSLFY